MRRPLATATVTTFLSHHHTDQAAADDFARQLRQQQLPLFQATHDLRPGDRWLARLQQALDGCAGFVVLVGRDGIQRWVAGEVEAALNRHFTPQGDGARLPIHPVLLPGATPADLPPFLALFQAQAWAMGQPVPDGLLQALRHAQPGLPPHTPFDGCPFLGLASFGEADAALFFGRRSETLLALRSLGDSSDGDPGQPRATGPGHVRWLQVEGHSGSGKSSLVKAGLLPMLRQGGGLWARTGFAHACVLGPLLPGAHPVARLAAVLEQGLTANELQRDSLGREQLLRRDARALAAHLADRARPDTAFVLLVDQFEELFTLADDAERQAFDALLANALQDDACPLYLVSTVRSDFLGQLALLPQLNALLNSRARRLLLPTIAPDGLRDAIEGPARLAGLDVGEVTGALLAEVQHEPGALPLVENALTQLWAERQGSLQGSRLSGPLLAERGGAAGLLSSGADALLGRIEAACGKPGRQGALELLLALTRVNRDDRLRHSRRRVAHGTAVASAGKGDSVRGAQVLRLLSGHAPSGQPHGASVGQLRLVTTGSDRDAAGDQPWVDLIHETLLRARPPAAPGAPVRPYWGTLYDYIEANRDRELLRQQLDLQVERWQGGAPGVRWLHLADWGQLLDYRPLWANKQPLAPDAARFLSLSRRAVALQGVALIAGLAWLSTAWWSEIRDNAAGAANTVFYAAAVPFWMAGERWLPVPETVQLPALPPGRTFQMGCRIGRDDIDGKCPDSEPERDEPMDKPCAIGKYEITNLQYNRFVWETKGAGLSALAQFPARGIFGTPGRPVVNVSWRNAQAYLAWLRDKTRQHWRLPTEAEWEYAARGTADGPYPWGRGSPVGKANCDDCGDEFSNSRTAPVGHYAANGFGLHNLAGNAWEWVEDRVQAGDAGEDASRVLRGGSWLNSPQRLRAALRYGGHPVMRSYDIGFRVCRVAPIEEPTTGALDAGPLQR